MINNTFCQHVHARFSRRRVTFSNHCLFISPKKAVELLGTMMGGYNVASLIDLLKDERTEIAQLAADALKKTLLVYDAFNDVIALAETNAFAKQVVESWAAAEWFTSKPEVPETITVTVFNVPGETNTDDLSPAPHVTLAQIFHSMLKSCWKRKWMIRSAP